MSQDGIENHMVYGRVYVYDDGNNSTTAFLYDISEFKDCIIDLPFLKPYCFSSTFSSRPRAHDKINMSSDPKHNTGKINTLRHNLKIIGSLSREPPRVM